MAAKKPVEEVAVLPEKFSPNRKFLEKDRKFSEIEKKTGALFG